MNAAAPALLTEPSRADLLAALEALEADLIRLRDTLVAENVAQGVRVA